MPLMKFDRRRRTGPAALEVGHPRQQLLEQDAGLEPGEARAEAEVRATGAERDVVVGRAADVEAVGIGKLRSSRLADDVPHHDLVARRGSTDPPSSRSSRAVRRKCITGVTQRSISSIAGREQRGVGREPGALVGVLEQRERAAGDEVAGGLAARVHQQHEEHVDVDLREPVAVDLGPQQHAQQVVAVTVDPLGGEPSA